MTFNKFWRALSPEQKKRLVADADTNYTHISNIANMRRGIGIKLASKLKKASSVITDKMIERHNATIEKARII